jgi:hypothetical protein
MPALTGDLLDSLVYFGRAVTGYRQHDDGREVATVSAGAQLAANCKSAGYVVGGREVRVAEAVGPMADCDLKKVNSQPNLNKVVNPDLAAPLWHIWPTLPLSFS